MKKKLRFLLGVLCLIFAFAGAACAGDKSYHVTLSYDETKGEVVLSPEKDAYAEGEKVTVTVTPHSGFTVESFKVNGEEEALTENAYSFAVEADTAVEVAFTPIPASTHTVTLSYDETKGEVALSPEKDAYAEGENVTVTVTPHGGFTVKSFKVNGEETSLTENAYSFAVEADTTVEVAFAARSASMPEELFAQLEGRTAYTGDGQEERLYDGYTEYSIPYKYSYQVAFDGENTHRFQKDESMKLVLKNVIYHNESGNAVSYTLKADNTFETVETGESFESYRNPFGRIVHASDFTEGTDGAYLLTDAEKASAAAQAFTGQSEEIATFAVYAEGGNVTFIMIETSENARGEGITIDYTYYASYTFDLTEPVDLSGRLVPYPPTADHAALEAALEAARSAVSYKYHVLEDGMLNYDYYVTEKAIYLDEKGFELGYVLHSDGIVHEFSPEGGKFVVGDALQVQSYDDGTTHTTSDIASLKPDFAGFAAELFEAKGDGVYALREENIDLIPDIAQSFWNFNDGMTMTFAQKLEITVQNGLLLKVSIVTYLYGYETTYVLTYSSWGETELPLKFGNEAEDPDGPDGPVVIPEKFYGTFEGDVGDYSAPETPVTHYVLTINGNGMAATVGGAPVTVAVVSYDAEEQSFVITFNGVSCTLSNYSNADAATADELGLLADDRSINVTLSRKTEGGGSDEPDHGDPTTYPEKFYGVYEGDYVDYSAFPETSTVHYVVEISAEEIKITVGGTPAETAFVSYDARHETIAITLNGKDYEIVNYSEGSTVDTINLSGSYPDPSVTLTRKTEEGESYPAKFYGTYTNDEYEVVISADSITVKIGGEEAAVTDISYSGGTIYLKVNGADYEISANSDDDPVSQIVLTYEVWHMAYLERQA